jgi:hypothetical protein
MRKELIPVRNYPGLAKDPKSNAVININKDEMNQARMRKQQRSKDRERIDIMELELAEMKMLIQELTKKNA